MASQDPQPLPLSDLPADILRDLLHNYLDIPSAACLALTSKLWKSIVEMLLSRKLGEFWGDCSPDTHYSYRCEKCCFCYPCKDDDGNDLCDNSKKALMIQLKSYMPVYQKLCNDEKHLQYLDVNNCKFWYCYGSPPDATAVQELVNWASYCRDCFKRRYEEGWEPRWPGVKYTKFKVTMRNERQVVTEYKFAQKFVYYRVVLFRGA